MSKAINPFKPTAGMNPPELIGRDAVLDDFAEALENGPGAPDRLMRISALLTCQLVCGAFKRIVGIRFAFCPS